MLVLSVPVLENQRASICAEALEIGPGTGRPDSFSVGSGAAPQKALLFLEVIGVTAAWI
jgi:hypothetical protein